MGVDMYERFLAVEGQAENDWGTIMSATMEAEVEPSFTTTQLSEVLEWPHIGRTVHYLGVHGYLPAGQGSGSRRKHSLNDAVVITCSHDMATGELGGHTLLGEELRHALLDACRTVEPLRTITVHHGSFSLTYRPPWELLLGGADGG